MGFETGIYVGARTGGGIPPGPPTQVRLGNTLIVSATGSDANGARQDVVYHFATINAALAASGDGDVIVVYPGIYNETISPGSDCRIHLMNGAILTNSEVVLFISSDIDVVITGDGLIVATAVGSGVVLLSGALYLECTGIVCEDGIGVAMASGTSTIIVKDKAVTNANGTAISIQDGIHFLYLNYCGDLIEDDSRVTDNGNFNAAIYVSNSDTSEVYIHAKKIRIRAFGITVVNGGANKFYLTADSIVNDSEIDPGLPLLHGVVYSKFRSDHLSVIKADIFANDFATGYITYDNGPNPQQNPLAKHYFFGNIKAEWGSAVIACGQMEGTLYLNGYFENTSESNPVVQIGDSSLDQFVKFLIVHVIGRVNALGGSSSAIFQYTRIPGDRNIQLVIDAVVYCTNVGAFSVQTDRAAREPVRIYRLISNVPSDPTTVDEIISLSIVDPLVI